MTLDDEILVDVLDRLRNRFFGKYRGVVTQVDAATMRIKATVPAVLTDQPTGWCRACVPYAGAKQGFAFLPEAGTGVWIEFEGGDVSYPIWTGCFWHDNEAPPQATEKVRAIVTKGGITILLDEGTDTTTVTITDRNNNKITLNSDGVTLQRGGKQIAINDKMVSVNDGALEVT
jgi:Type VI secretion system/phage-baseplate injector OB domain